MKLVEWGGVRGYVKTVGRGHSPVQAIFLVDGIKRHWWFTEDGRVFPFHTEPSLKLIYTAKKKRKVKLYAYLIKQLLESEGFCLYWYSVSDMKYRRVPELDKEVEVDE